MAISSKVRQANKPKRKKEPKQASEETRRSVPMQMEITRQRLAKLLDELQQASDGLRRCTKL